MARNKGATDEPVLIKKYANRRLYNTATASFVTLDDLHEMVKRDKDFIVKDARTGKDLTSSVLTQIIAEEESKGSSLFPASYLRQTLKLYSEGIGAELSSYLERSVESFASSHNQMLNQMHNVLGNEGAMEKLTEIGQQNLEFFQKSMQTFTANARQSTADQEKPDNPEPSEDSKMTEIDKLTKELADIQKRLDALARNQ